jgi:hypothetical protein
MGEAAPARASPFRPNQFPMQARTRFGAGARARGAGQNSASTFGGMSL